MAANDGFGCSIDWRFACGFLVASAFTARAGLAFAQPFDAPEIVLLASFRPAINHDADAHKSAYSANIVANEKINGLQLTIPMARGIQLASLSMPPPGSETGDASGWKPNEDSIGEHQDLTPTTWISVPPLLPRTALPPMVAEGYHFAADATGHTGSALNLSPWSLQDGSLTRWGRGSGTNLTFGGSTYARPLADTPVAGISKDPDVRRQAVVNWQFSSIFQTSVGWESIQGGKPFAYGRASADKGDPKRLRATQSIILGNNARLVLDVTKTSVVVGPVKHATVGALRFVYGF